MDNHEEILDALTAFGKNPNPQEIPSVLEQYLNSVAKNGETLFPWSQLKPLILRKMELVISELRRNLGSENIPTRPNVENVRFDVIHARIIDSLHKFNGAPFTIQRLCELLIDPKRHYKRSDKFMRGLEKNVLVVSTVDPFGRKVVSELGSKPVLNGILDINGSYPPRDTALSVPLPPVPGWVNTAAANRSTALGASVVDATKTGSDNNVNTLGKDSGEMVSNSIPVSGTQVFSDQGDPLAVQSEEVVEETVVTMDTAEVNSVVTDGGEALADRELEGDVGEDRDASSFSSSSSSSSEELSTSSDSIENNLRCSSSPLDMATTGLNEDVTAMDENRPWAAFAQDMKQQQDDLGPTPLSSSSTQPVTEENQTGVSSSSPHNTLTADVLPSSSLSMSSSTHESSETQSSLLSTSTSSRITSKLEGHQEEEEESRIPLLPNQQTTSSSDLPATCDESSPADINQSLGIDPSSSPQHTYDITKTTTEKQISSSTNSVIPSTTTTTTTTTSSTIENNSNNPSSVVHTSSTSAACDDDAVPEPPTYAQVVASSTTDKMSSSTSLTPIQHISPYDSTTEPVPSCDSVAGLERLVGSVEQSLSSSTSSSSNAFPSSSASSQPSSSHPSPLTTASQNNSSAVTTSSLPESSRVSLDSNCQTTPSSSLCCSSEEGEPASKRPRLSVDEESMEEDCISTSADSCIQQEGDQQQRQKEDNSGTVHSSSVTEHERLQQSEMPEDDIQMEDGDEGITTGTAPVVEEDEKMDGSLGFESTSGSIDDSDVNKSDVVAEKDEGIESTAESSTVSTTDSENRTPQIEDE